MPLPTRHRVFFRVCTGLVHVLLWLLRRTSAERFGRFARPVVRTFVSLAVSRRRMTAIMDAAFGESCAPATKRGLAKGVQRQCADGIVDCLIHVGHPERLRGIVRIRGIDHLDAALRRGRGVIALGFHFGNFLLLGAALGLQGYAVHCLFRFLEDERFMELVRRHSRRFFAGLIPSIPARDAARKILAVLGGNDVVLILGDSLKRGELETRLFGRPVRSSRGAASLAIRSGAAVLPMHLVRGYAGEPELVIEEEMEMVRTGDLRRDVQANTDRFMERLEDLVRRYPDQWHWLTARIPPRDEALPPKGVA